MQSEFFMVELGFDFVVKLKGFATVSQKVLECNFMLMSSHMICLFSNLFANGSFVKTRVQTTNMMCLICGKRAAVPSQGVATQRKCCLFLLGPFFLPKLQFATMFNEHRNICEDINTKLHSNTFCKTVAQPYNLKTKSKPSLTIKVQFASKPWQPAGV